MSITRTTYSPLHKSLHWLMAVLMIAMLAMGLLLEQVNGLMWWHKSTGILVLALVVARSLSRVLGSQPELDETAGPAWQRKVAMATHLALYGCMFAMPLSGWMMSSAAGRPVSFYGLFEMPALVHADTGLRKLAGLTHDVLYKVLIALIVLHVAAALYHHFVKKDGTLKRMLP